MKHLQLHIAIALLLGTTTLGSESSKETSWTRLQLLQSGTTQQMSLTPLDQAYLDARSLLIHKGKCSEFFGASAAAHVLDELTVRLGRKSMNQTGVGMKMSGPFIYFIDTQRKISYRLFAEAEINTTGGFYRSKVFPADPSVPNVGSFPPNTREARSLMLMHELAHLIRGHDGNWLIPDDGDSPTLSRQNTRTVESYCGRQLRALDRNTATYQPN